LPPVNLSQTGAYSKVGSMSILSINLKNNGLTVRKSRDYSDLNLSFEKNIFTNDILKKLDLEAVKASIKHLILTKNYERPFHPEIGCQVHSLLFENFTPTIKIAMEKSIFDTIAKFEPRARIIDLDVSDDQDYNGIRITVTFMVGNIDQPVTVNTILTRAR
jgi:phage baseplate assembly protein W